VTEAAERIADELFFPAANETDRAEIVPVELLDALADAGLYGLTGPGSDADFSTVCSVIEALASGCLTTTFVWAQHLGAVRAAAASENPPVSEWIAPLCRGERRAGLALGGALRSPTLSATATADGWSFSGLSPFVSGWSRIDVMHTAARTEDGRIVWALIDAEESETLVVERLELVALNATATVRAAFREHPVAAERVTSVLPVQEGPAPSELLRIHAAFPLGVARRCCRLIGSSLLDDELARVREELDRLDPDTIEQARARAGAVALRAATALAARTGSRSLLLADHAQRLVREALFCVVYALPPRARDELLTLVGAR
jgi:alkylation response protein AidB-like acyl-CoA dehydrogenase